MTFGFALSDSEFKQIQDIVYKNFGIFLTDQKRNLVISRLQGELVKLGMKSFAEYYAHVSSDKTGNALDALVNRISTNFTYFYREEAHFEYFKATFLPEWKTRLATSGKDLRIWSAGCASGEEPYTLVMLMRDYFGGEYSLWNAGILATDISDSALEFARKALYPPDRLQKIPPLWRTRFFDKEGNDFKVKDEVQREVTFRRFNLMNATFPFKKRFHAIFCRNVMIYFEADTRRRLVQKYVDMLEPGGHLFIGHSETLGRDDVGLEYVIPALYRKPL